MEIRCVCTFHHPSSSSSHPSSSSFLSFFSLHAKVVFVAARILAVSLVGVEVLGRGRSPGVLSWLGARFSSVVVFYTLLVLHARRAFCGPGAAVW